MDKKNLLVIILINLSCWSGPQSPAINSSYNFNNVDKIEIHEISDYFTNPGSGKIVSSSLTYYFLKYGYSITEGENNKSIVHINKGNQTLEVFCIITEYADSELIVVPYRNEDRGYTKTIVKQSLESDKENKNPESSQLHSSTTITHGGKLKVGNHIEYTQTRAGIMLKILDKDSGELVWSNSYWYSGLEMQQTIDTCIKNSVRQIQNLFNPHN